MLQYPEEQNRGSIAVENVGAAGSRGPQSLAPLVAVWVSNLNFNLRAFSGGLGLEPELQHFGLCVNNN